MIAGKSPSIPASPETSHVWVCRHLWFSLLLVYLLCLPKIYNLFHLYGYLMNRYSCICVLNWLIYWPLCNAGPTMSCHPIFGRRWRICAINHTWWSSNNVNPSFLITTILSMWSSRLEPRWRSCWFQVGLSLIVPFCGTYYMSCCDFFKFIHCNHCQLVAIRYGYISVLCRYLILFIATGIVIFQNQRANCSSYFKNLKELLVLMKKP